MIPVLIDEMNLMHQLHRVNVQGLTWKELIREISKAIECPAKGHFFCANVPKWNSETYEKRAGYFARLKQDGLEIHEGYSVYDQQQRLLEKGVDVMLAMKGYEFALKGAKDIIICSADTDLVPAVKMIQAIGCRVHILVSDFAQAKELTTQADRVISLEKILEKLASKRKLRWKNTTKPIMFNILERDKLREGVVI